MVASFKTDFHSDIVVSSRLLWILLGTRAKQMCGRKSLKIREVSLSARKRYSAAARKMAIDRLSSCLLTALEKVVLGRQYQVHKWLRSGYVELVIQAFAITTEQADAVGHAVALSLLRRLREELRRKQNVKRKTAGSRGCVDTVCCYCGNEFSKADVEKAVDEEFKNELKEVLEEDDRLRNSD
ncbi:hypothetical protein D9758_005361 [Tetrapyrgos nigripes]|uniref:Uncharacterized protein n=1 Tax=Tetrapyrgos nigripes TaxID=182062 RepID=A0A8H5GHJ7_9AGAR|nr:hypothetical protein D9758_005361 [Tetrapyrgos nigripes]